MTHPELERWRKIRGHLCWSSTALAQTLAALVFVRATPSVPTVTVTPRGTVHVNVEWSAKQPPAEIAFAILHNVLHLVLSHHTRREGRIKPLWAIAADLVINEVLDSIKLETPVTRPAAALWRPRDAPFIKKGQTVEAVYAQLGSDGRPMPTSAGPGSGCDVNDAAEESADALSEPELGDLCDAVAKGASSTGLSALKTLFEPVRCTVRWETLLRATMAHATSAASPTTESWDVRNRRAPRWAILPGVVATMQQIAVVIDSSGSMSDRDLSACISETRGAVVASQTSAFLVVHDHEVQTATWITPQDPAVKIAGLVAGRGGTLYQPAYDEVAACRKQFSSMIHFTDAMPCDPWPPRPRNCKAGIAALTRDASDPPPGWRKVHVTVR